MSGPCSLYRFYDASDRLLYVGISGNPVQRTFQHRGQTWWAEVARSTVEHFSEHDLARAAEQHAIDVGRPLYNRIRSVGSCRVRTARVPDDLWAKAQARAKHDRETVTDVLRRALEDYTEGWEPEDEN